MPLTSQIDKVIVLQPVDGLKPAAHIKLLCGVEQVLDGGVLLVSSKHLLGLDSPSKEKSCQHPSLASEGSS
jgi:hypothetical protein